MIFIGYKDNGYCFICHIQGNVIFHSKYAIFDKKFFSKCTDSYVKEYKLYDKLLDKISPETESSVFGPSSKDRPTLVFIPISSIPFDQNNLSADSFSHSLSYKSLSSLFSLVLKWPSVKVEEIKNDINTNVEIQPSNPQ